MDDIFVLFASLNSAHLFDYIYLLNTGAQFCFYRSKICCKNDKFALSVYRTPTCNRVFTNYEIFVYTLLHRSFHICCDFQIFHLEFDHFREYPQKKIIILWSLLILVSSHSWINFKYLKLVLRLYIKWKLF